MNKVHILYVNLKKHNCIWQNANNYFFTYTIEDFFFFLYFQNSAGGTSGKELTCHCRRCKRGRFDPWVRKIPRRRAWQPTPVFLPGESHGQKSLAGYGPWDHKELDTTEHISTHTHIFFIISHMCLYMLPM